MFSACSSVACSACSIEKEIEEVKMMEFPCNEVLQSCCQDDSRATHLSPEDSVHRALLCCGVRADMSQISSALSTLKLRPPCSVSDVRLLAFHLLSVGSQPCRPVIPHCHRGMRLQHLRKMDDALITSGWLKERCAQYNSADDVQAGARFALHEDLYGLDKLLVRDATSGQVPELMIPLLSDLGVTNGLSQDPCSFSELLYPMGLKEVHFFVSHYWGHPFAATVAALGDFAAHRESVASFGDAVSFWICSFCLNQHRITDELGDSPDDAPFNIALSKATHGMVMVLDGALSPFRRIWCLYEVSRANDLGRSLSILTGSHTQDAAEHALRLSRISHKLREVHAFDALSSSESDKLSILHRIMDASHRERYAELAHFIHHFKNSTSPMSRIDSRYFLDFDTNVRELLSTPLFRAELEQGRLEEAMQYAAFANFSVADLQRLIELKGDIRSRVSGLVYGELATLTLLHKAACKGSDTVRYLIEARADLESPLETIHVPGEGIIAMLQDNSTPLHAACLFGNVTAVQILLDAGADVLSESGKSQCLMPPIHYAASGSRQGLSLEIAKLLVQRKADALVKDKGQNSLLHHVVAKPDTNFTEFVLQQGLSVNVADGEGATPLHVAANWGMVGQIQHLCNSKADIGATKTDGATALHRAARSGHVEAAKALLLHGASAHIPDSSGHSAIEVARHSGHPAVSDFMLGEEQQTREP
mmetsp:Transcript_45620/g.108582  ORF Transcript_45620/g.108582 Transcript_45620/m.108582 type:complete len:707 (-) Transcript_45620:241-2361(-)